MTSRPMARQDALLVEKLETYMAWAAEDTRVAGIVPWHWGERGHGRPRHFPAPWVFWYGEPPLKILSNNTRILQGGMAF